MKVEIKLEITRQVDFDNLMLFLKETSVKHSILTVESVPLLESSAHYIPTPQFKTFCGSEYLTSKGYISLNSAKEFILFYAKKNNLYFQTYIELSPILRTALSTELNTLLISDIDTELVRIFRTI
jgi:hypothetical protein